MPLPGIIAGVGLGTSLLGQIGKLGLGVTQLFKGAKMKPERPTYEIPDEIKQRLGLAQMNLNARMAGATQAERNIQTGLANQLGTASRAATDSSQLLASAAAGQGQVNRANVDLATSEAQDRQRRIQELAQAQTQMAGYRDKEFDLNKMMPFQDAVRTKAALTQGGLTNTYNALMDMSALAGKFYTNQDQVAGMFGGGGGSQGGTQPLATIGTTPLPSSVQSQTTPGLQPSGGMNQIQQLLELLKNNPGLLSTISR